ncbi:hypothetical protein CJ14980A_0957 [Campylobacter jejuni subsp. jejuni]|nr:hypothetical protein CJ14980A_0947 [Campylobacter jejuni subsp. jejuni]AOH51986.1 hypothetical protein CJ14980A_0957 [Campylobacter jejuni subsp. jejuni]
MNSMMVFGVFWGIIFLFSSLYAYFSDIEFFGDMLKIAFFIYSYPLLPYISYLTLQETIKSKNIFLYYFVFFIHFFVSFYFLKLTISKIMLNLYRLVFFDFLIII